MKRNSTFQLLNQVMQLVRHAISQTSTHIES